MSEAKRTNRVYASMNRVVYRGVVMTPSVFIKQLVYDNGAYAREWRSLIDADALSRINDEARAWVDEKIEWQLDRLASWLGIEKQVGALERKSTDASVPDSGKSESDD